MTSFRFNLGSFRSRCDNIRVNLLKYKNISEQTYITAKSIINSWNDPASEAFFDKVKKDEIKNSQIYTALEDYQNNLEYFGNELSNIFSNVGINNNNLNVNYDSYYIDGAKQELNTVKNHIRTAQKAFEDCEIPYGFDNLPVLNEIFNALYNDIGALADAIENKLNNTCNQINGLISTAQSKNNSIQFVSIDDKITQVNANTVYMNPISISTENETNKSEVRNVTTSIESENISLNDEDKSAVLDYIGSAKAEDIILNETNDTIISGGTTETSINEKINNDDVENSSNFMVNDVEKQNVNINNEEEDNNINYQINEINTDINIVKPEDENNGIKSETLKVNSDEIVIKHNDDSIKINSDIVGTNSNDMTLNLSSKDDLNLNTNNISVGTNTSMNLNSSSETVDINTLGNDVSTNTNININKTSNVTAEDILNETK